MAPRRPVVLSMVLAFTLGAAACTGGRGGDDCGKAVAAASPSGSAASPALVVSPAPATLPTAVGALPQLSCRDFDGLLTDLSDHGTPVVVNVWAAWCEPCKEETPRLVAAANEHPEVQFLGVDMEDSRSGAESFIDSYRVPYPSVFDPGGDIFRHLGGGGPPLTVFYAADGSELARVPGPVSQEKLDDYLAQLTG